MNCPHCEKDISDQVETSIDWSISGFKIICHNCFGSSWVEVETKVEGYEIYADAPYPKPTFFQKMRCWMIGCHPECSSFTTSPRSYFKSRCACCKRKIYSRSGCDWYLWED